MGKSDYKTLYLSSRTMIAFASTTSITSHRPPFQLDEKKGQIVVGNSRLKIADVVKVARSNWPVSITDDENRLQRVRESCD